MTALVFATTSSVVAAAVAATSTAMATIVVMAATAILTSIIVMVAMIAVLEVVATRMVGVLGSLVLARLARSLGFVGFGVVFVGIGLARFLSLTGGVLSIWYENGKLKWGHLHRFTT